MKHNLDNNVLTIYLSDVIDANTSSQIEEEIFSILSSNTYSKLILDFDEVTYVSSAGLRVILKIKKHTNEVEIINVSRDVYDVFEMTGFIEIMSIKKGLRKLVLEDAEEIGRGANGKVYRYKGDMVVKVYYSKQVTLEEIQNEINLAKKAFVMGIPTAIPFDIVKVGEYFGSVFELINAKSLANLINEDPTKLEQYIIEFVEFLKNIHNIQISDNSVPSIVPTCHTWVNYVKDLLDAPRAAKLIKMVDEIPALNTMLHGDYHVKNVMIQNGEMILIDMDTVCKGSILFELSGMYNAFKAFIETELPTEKPFLSLPKDITDKIWDIAYNHYFLDKSEQFKEETLNKIQLISYMRLCRIFHRKSDNPDNKIKFDYYLNKLVAAIDKVDNLIIE